MTNHNELRDRLREIEALGGMLAPQKQPWSTPWQTYGVTDTESELRESVWEQFAPASWHEHCPHLSAAYHEIHSTQHGTSFLWPEGLGIVHLWWVLTHVEQLLTVEALVREAETSYRGWLIFRGHPVTPEPDLLRIGWNLPARPYAKHEPYGVGELDRMRSTLLPASWGKSVRTRHYKEDTYESAQLVRYLQQDIENVQRDKAKKGQPILALRNFYAPLCTLQDHGFGVYGLRTFQEQNNHPYVNLIPPLADSFAIHEHTAWKAAKGAP